MGKIKFFPAAGQTSGRAEQEGSDRPALYIALQHPPYSRVFISNILLFSASVYEFSIFNWQQEGAGKPYRRNPVYHKVKSLF
jgi:hypothetical protein